MNNFGSPLQANQRLSWVDAARGFAIFGIFIVNTPAFNAPFFLYGGEKLYWTSGLDYFIQTVIDIFFQASFYTLFSFLFGFGVQMMVERLREKGLPYEKVIFRRLLILIGFGLIHAFLLWHGDILLTYGLIGMLLFFFFNSKNRTLLYWSFGLSLGTTALITGLLFMVRNQIQDPVNRRAINQAFANYGDGTLLEIWSQNYQDWVYANGGGGYLFLIAGLLPLFLLGMYTARKRWLHQPKAFLSIWKRIWIVSLIVFILFKAGPYLFGTPYWMSYVQDNIGGPASAFFYLATFVLLYIRGFALIGPFAYVGRMALTNYLLQSVISFLLYYSVGFGLYGDIRPLWSVLIVVILFALQVFVSAWWLERFRFGPVEWLWRSLTYGKKQQLKRGEANE